MALVALRKKTALNQPRRRQFQESIRSVIEAAGIPALRRENRGFVVGVTSPSAGEGKTTVAMATAGILSADLNVDVALVDSDFETHSLVSEYELAGREGIADVLAGTATMESVMHRVPGTRLDVVAAGELPSDPGPLIRSGELTNFIEQLRASYAYVVLDLPAVLPSSSGRTVAGLCDGVIVVTSAGQTTRSELEETIERLAQTSVLGVVINNWRSRVPAWLERAFGLGS